MAQADTPHALGDVNDVRESAKALIGSGQYDEADKVVENGLIAFPNDHWLHYHHANCAEARGHSDAALLRWSRFVDLFPLLPFGFTGKGRVLNAVGRHDEADRLLSEVIHRFPEDVWIHWQWATTATLRRDLPEAIKRWEFTLMRFPDFALAYSALGTLFRESGNLSRSETLLEQGAEKFPDDADIQWQRAVNARMSGPPREAARRWAMVCGLKPRDSDALLSYVKALLADDRPEEAFQAAEAGLKRIGRSSPVIKAVALARAHRGAAPATAGQASPERGRPVSAFGFWSGPGGPESAAIADWRSVFGDDYRVVPDDEVSDIIKRHYQRLVGVYDRIAIPAARADVARLICMHHFGGMYSDVHCGPKDVAALLRLLAKLSRYDVVLLNIIPPDKGYIEITNTAMAARQGSAVVRTLIERVTDNLVAQLEAEQKAGNYVPYDIFFCLGPVVLQKEFMKAREINVGLYEHYRSSVCIVPNFGDDAPLEFYRYYGYRKPGTHWSERQKTERLFLP